MDMEFTSYVIEGLTFRLDEVDDGYDIVWVTEEGQLETINGDIWYDGKPSEQEIREFIVSNKMADEYPELGVIKAV